MMKLIILLTLSKNDYQINVTMLYMLSNYLEIYDLGVCLRYSFCIIHDKGVESRKYFHLELVEFNELFIRRTIMIKMITKNICKLLKLSKL